MDAFDFVALLIGQSCGSTSALGVLMEVSLVLTFYGIFSILGPPLERLRVRSRSWQPEGWKSSEPQLSESGPTFWTTHKCQTLLCISFLGLGSPGVSPQCWFFWRVTLVPQPSPWSSCGSLLLQIHQQRWRGPLCRCSILEWCRPTHCWCLWGPLHESLKACSTIKETHRWCNPVILAFVWNHEGS